MPDHEMSDLSDGTAPDVPLSFSDILLDEQKAIDRGKPRDGEWAAERYKDDLDVLLRAIREKDRTALCLSGGGIRSAAFSLGVIQRLAKQTVSSRHGAPTSAIAEFDYLSTVSGGGYTGSWLSAWICRSKLGIDPPVTESLNARSNGREADPLRHLRANSRYLARHGGMLSADLWADIACCVRNLSLVWLIIIPTTASVILAMLIAAAGALLLTGSVKVAVWSTVAITAGAISLGYEAANIPTRRVFRVHMRQFYMFSGLCWIVACLATVVGVSNNFELKPAIVRNFDWDLPAMKMVGLGALAYLMLWCVTALLPKSKSQHWATPNRNELGQVKAGTKARHEYRALVGWVIAGGLFGLLVWCGLLAASWLGPLFTRQIAELILIIVGPPYLTLARLIGDTIYAALAERVTDADVDLEWLSRVGGYFLMWLLAWLTVMTVVLLGPAFVQWCGRFISVLPTVSITTILSGLGAAIIGWNPSTGPVAMLRGVGKRFTLQQLATALAALFALGGMLIMSTLLDKSIFYSAFARFAPPTMSQFYVAVIATVVLVILAATASFFVNINRFSLHGLYRNRLMRTFLGASKSKVERAATRDPFTDYDGNDTPLLRELRVPADVAAGGGSAKDWAPLHVINVSANASSSKDLALQERRAIPFTFSALHAGSAALYGSKSGPGAYRSVRLNKNVKGPYGGTIGLTLATAMAISGAAINPNMGYYTSPGVSFLMALFNIRLGWWLANPASKHVDYSRTGPSSAFQPLLSEIFGATSDQSLWLLLTDGGHFDNTGLYEMVRRRCALIVLVDGGCDAAYEFSDLGRTLEKVRVDFGIQIRLQGIDKLVPRFSTRPTPATTSPYWDVAKIGYSEVDSKCADGLLVYIKAGLHGTEPLDVLNYGLTHPAFPHDTTVDQFYGEAQFEAYRALGYEIGDQMLIKASAGRASSGKTTSATMEDLLSCL